MNAATTAYDAYDAQLSRYARALAAGRIGPVLPDLMDGSGPADVQRYVDNAEGERIRMLVEDAALVGLVLDDLEAQALDYVRHTPRGAYAFGRRETPQFLDWLRATSQLTFQQADFLAYQLAEFACLELAYQRRDEYLRFVAACEKQAAAQRGNALIRDPMLHVHPIRVWGRLSVATGNSESPCPRSTLFFARGEQIQHAAFDAYSADLLRQLETLAPCAPSEWARACGLSAIDAVTLIALWIGQGIVVVTSTKILG